MRRDEDLYERKIEEMISVYRKVAPECWTQKQAFERVVNHPASGFFILPQTACNVVRNMYWGRSDHIRRRSGNQARMYEEIYRRIMEKSQKPEYSGMSLVGLCTIVVDEPAPEFYMSVDSFRNVFSREKAKLRMRYENRRKP
jgi:hypothetical protein